VNSQLKLERAQVYRDRVLAALASRLPVPDTGPQQLHRAMRYASLDGGKRLRAMLVYASGEVMGAGLDELDVPACAVELIHAYSLIHDDLPAMDDDDLRRGKPACHIAFDEATAILAGDALQALAFELLAGDPAMTATAEQRCEMIRVLAQASGTAGLVGGQALDLSATGRRIDLAELEAIHLRKTGALIRAAVRLGVLAARDQDMVARDALDQYSVKLGLAFQVIDDILDDSGQTATLGKPAGSDRARDKPTYATLLGPAQAREFADRLYNQALASLRPLGDNARILQELARLLVDRSY